MREIASEGTYSSHCSYLMHERLIFDVWCPEPGQIVIYTENVIDEPHDDQIRTFRVDDRRLYTRTTNRQKMKVPSWEAFLADPITYFMEVML